MARISVVESGVLDTEERLHGSAACQPTDRPTRLKIWQKIKQVSPIDQIHRLQPLTAQSLDRSARKERAAVIGLEAARSQLWTNGRARDKGMILSIRTQEHVGPDYHRFTS